MKGPLCTSFGAGRQGSLQRGGVDNGVQPPPNPCPMNVPVWQAACLGILLLVPPAIVGALEWALLTQQHAPLAWQSPCRVAMHRLTAKRDLPPSVTRVALSKVTRPMPLSVCNPRKARNAPMPASGGVSHAQGVEAGGVQVGRWATRRCRSCTV